MFLDLWLLRSYILAQHNHQLLNVFWHLDVVPSSRVFLSCTIYIMCCHGRRLYGSCWFFSIGFSLTRILLCFHGFLSIRVHSDYNIVETLHGLEIGKDAHVHIVQICLCIKLNACERISILIYTYTYKMLRQILRHIRPCGTSKATHQINQVPAECQLIHGALSFHCHHVYIYATHTCSITSSAAMQALHKDRLWA